MLPSKIALFIDYENFHHYNVNIKEVVNILERKGRIQIKIAYADWGQFGNAKQQMATNTIQTVELPQYKGKKKNSCDIRLVVDAMEVALQKDYIDTIAIVSSDSDFIPLISKLQGLNKRVIVFADPSSMNPILGSHCDELVSLSAPPKKNFQPAFALLRQAMKSVQASHVEILSSHVKKCMRQIEPGFCEKELGFQKFKFFLQEAAKQKVLRYKEATNGEYFLYPFSQSPNRPHSRNDLIVRMNESLRKEIPGSGYLGQEIHRFICSSFYAHLSTKDISYSHSQVKQLIVEQAPWPLSKKNIDRVTALLKYTGVLSNLKREGFPSTLVLSAHINSVEALLKAHDQVLIDVARKAKLRLSMKDKQALLLYKPSHAQDAAA